MSEKNLITEVRRAIADYMQSEGCSCCQNIEAHKKHAKALARLLRIPMYKDRSGYNFAKFRSRNNPLAAKRSGRAVTRGG